MSAVEYTGRAAHPRTPGGRPPGTYLIRAGNITFIGCKVDDPDDTLERLWAACQGGAPAPRL